MRFQGTLINWMFTGTIRTWHCYMKRSIFKNLIFQMINWMFTYIQNYQNIYPPSATLHLSNIPASVEESDLKQAFQNINITIQVSTRQLYEVKASNFVRVFMKNIFYSIFLLGDPLWKKSSERVKSRPCSAKIKILILRFKEWQRNIFWLCQSYHLGC